ncbi:TPA: DNA primase, partial [Klebsiella variicola]
RDLPIHELYGYRDKGADLDEPVLFYVLPAPFKNEVAKGFTNDTVARTLSELGMLKKTAHEIGWQFKTSRLKHLNNAQPWTYILLLAPELGEEKTQ